LNRLSRAREGYRQTTDGRAITYSEREREYTFAKKYQSCSLLYMQVIFFVEEAKGSAMITDIMPYKWLIILVGRIAVLRTYAT